MLELLDTYAALSSPGTWSIESRRARRICFSCLLSCRMIAVWKCVTTYLPTVAASIVTSGWWLMVLCDGVRTTHPIGLMWLPSLITYTCQTRRHWKHLVIAKIEDEFTASWWKEW